MKKIILQGRGACLRAAVIERGELTEVLEEECSGLTGSIYRARVENVLPGMQAAFVDIGLEKNAFLTIQPGVDIRALLQPRQALVVQLIKEPTGNKGARVTTELTLPGRYAVLLPAAREAGVSLRIDDPAERERLKNLAATLCPAGMGLILRTMAEGQSSAEIAADIQKVSELWRRISQRIEHTPIPGLIYREANLLTILTRDVIDGSVEQIIVDDENTAGLLRSALREIKHPAARCVRVNLRDDLWEIYDVHQEISKALRPKVWLKCGGYLVIEPTEALVVIDVNTGKNTGKQSMAETILQTNVEAAAEIARQLRLRNLGGIIVIDFIDMEREEDRLHVLKQLEQSCQNDKMKFQVVGLTKLGLVEMTRKRAGKPLSARYTI
ncbi:MAG: Rne/Rng family ribonuclease [Peptococcaceae bacterium]|nr:Rne/Rng family ribonuclease [Peptococcaceae bacterium]